MVTGRIKDGYGIIQRDIMKMPINVYSKVVYALLVSYAGAKESCYPSLKTICLDLDISKPTVIKAIKELQFSNLIIVTRNKTSLGDFDNNTYEPLFIMKEVVNHINNDVVSQDYNGSKPEIQQVVNEIDTNNNNTKNNSKEQIIKEKIEKLKIQFLNEESWLELFCMQNGVNKDFLLFLADKYFNELILNEELHKDLKDAKMHFNRWVRSHKYKYEKEFKELNQSAQASSSGDLFNQPKGAQL